MKMIQDTGSLNNLFHADLNIISTFYKAKYIAFICKGHSGSSHVYCATAYESIVFS
jgi:hypothetical protein